MNDVERPAADFEIPAETEHVVQRDLVVVGASAGGVEALQYLVAELPSEFPASVLVVLHLMTAGTSVLDSILGRAGDLQVSQGVDGERLERGHVYVAPPDFHMLVRGPFIHLSAGPRENGHRPAVDPLFRSAARAFGARVIGVVLSGTLDDGTDGLRLIKERGGATVVQDPDDATYGEMPRSAMEYVSPDRVVPKDRLGPTLSEIIDIPLDSSSSSSSSSSEVSDPDSQPVDLVEVELGRHEHDGEATLLTCPDCGGVLLERDEGGGVVRFACQVGHAFSPESLVEHQGDALESALWSALRTLEERADLLRRMARRAERRGIGQTGTRLDRRADLTSSHADAIRSTILRLRDGDSEAAPSTEPA
jgi:two-component system chemotaxis response regulator CheB